MLIIIPMLLNIFSVIGFYLLEKKGKLTRLKNIHKQLIIGCVFGFIAMLSSEFGMPISGAVMNVRDSAPLSAGLIFGWQAGIIAGVLGGVYRAVSTIWSHNVDTMVACTISTIVAGLVAAGLRKFMFDDKKPSWTMACGIAVVMEVFHMLMIFLMKLSDSGAMFTFVRACTIPMSALNALTVGLSVFIVTLLSKEKLRREKGKEQIAQTFQRWLVISILIAFSITTVFTIDLQTGIRERQVQDTFKSTMEDVIEDIKGKSDDTLKRKVVEVRQKYLEEYAGNTYPLTLLSKEFGVKEINIVNSSGIVVRSTEANLLPGGEDENFNMASTEQSKEFMVLIDEWERDKIYVQEYGAVGSDESGKTMRKFAGICLPSGGFLQIGYNEKQFRSALDQFAMDFTKNRRIGVNGFVAVCDENLNLITEQEKSNGKHVSVIGIQPNEEMLAKKPSSTIYKTNITGIESDYKEEYFYIFSFAEEYCVIVAMPKDDAMLIRDASAYLSIFMMVIVFGVLFVLLYFLIKRVIIDNIYKINDTLSKISSGNLSVSVDVRSNVEFASLSDDINTTVGTLKRYIKEAAARIDQELEYAKQIQTSALPSKFPSEREYQIFAKMIAAKEVGGDFYDFYKLSDETVAFLVADVSGKGIPAAMFMMTAKTIIKDLAERGLAVNDILTIANQKLCENNESGMFVTAWMGILNTSTGVLEFANAGHNPPLLLQNGKFEYLKSRAGFVLAGMEGVKYKKNEIQLNIGDRIFLYTDGVTEATDSANQLYGEQRLIDFMNKNAKEDMLEILPKLKEDIDNFVGDAPQFDDITMLICDYKDCSGDDKFVEERVFPAKVEALNEVIAFTEQKLEQFSCSAKNSMAICVAVEEIFVNVARYAYSGAEGEFRFSIGFDEKAREIAFVASDSGAPFDPLAKEDPNVTLSVEERKIGGLGIFITKKTMDRIFYRYENGENILTMIKKI